MKIKNSPEVYDRARADFERDQREAADDPPYKGGKITRGRVEFIRAGEVTIIPASTGELSIMCSSCAWPDECRKADACQRSKPSNEESSDNAE